MTTTCWSSVRGTVARFTRLDDCGYPGYPGPCGQLVTDGFISIEFAPEYEEAEEIVTTRANGSSCTVDKACDYLKWFNLEISLCQVDPDLMVFLAGYELVIDHAGDSVGNRIGQDIQCDFGFALEVWSELPGQVCSVTGAKAYGYTLIPWASYAVISDFTIENDAATFAFSAKSKAGGQWGIGPHLVEGDRPPAEFQYGLNTPIGPHEHLDMHVVTLAPPLPSCGCRELPGP